MNVCANERLQVRVRARRKETDDIASFELARADGGELPEVQPGAHIDVHLDGGFVRQYSLLDARRDRYRIAVLKDPASRGGSVAMHERVHEGQDLWIGAPRNHFSLAPQAGASILIAGGIGITPIACMADALQQSGQPFALHYGARSRRHMAFEHQLAEHLGGAARFYFDDEARPDLRAILASPSPEVHVYVCGPQGLIDAVLDTARACGWPDANVHHERFGAAAPPADGNAFEVELARTGRVVRVPGHLSVARALQAEGVCIPLSCEQGVCGTCLTRVLGGVPDHRDFFLSDDEKTSGSVFLPCCSRSLSARLVLDV